MTSSKEARIEICTLCNHSCVFCPHKDMTRNKTTMSQELFKFIVDKLKKEAPNISVITISGMGEMFIDTNIIKKIQYCKEQGYKVHVLNNASLLTTDIIDSLINLKVESIRISLHSLNKNTYLKITGTQLDSGLEIIDYISRNKSTTRLIITSDIIDDNKNEISNLIDFFKNKVDLLEIWKPHNWVNWGEYRKGIRSKTTCGRPLNGPLQIQVDGTINMCCFDYNGLLEMGDFKTQSLTEIFNSPMYNRILNYHQGKEDEILCSKCDQLYENDSSNIVYNSGYSSQSRLQMTSTLYEELK